ncbi:hypothetical protein NIES4106_28240 [Fischerella sp. NIES-4106]|nr:hypothetical protein NIES4106_28240 [Fischerella sp. NIES-4106]
MTIWIDAHLSPAIATWISDTFGIEALSLRDIGLRDAEDSEIFEAAKVQEIIFMTKDSDFVDLVERLGSPPKIIWLTCGNTSNAKLREILSATLLKALELLNTGESLVEIQWGLARYILNLNLVLMLKS